jgi:hypothetical protein
MTRTDVGRAASEGHIITMTPDAPSPYRAVTFDFGGARVAGVVGGVDVDAP